MKIHIKVSKLLSIRAVRFLVMICPILENPLSTIASDISIKAYIFIRRRTKGRAVLTKLSRNRSSTEREFNFLFVASSSSIEEEALTRTFLSYSFMNQQVDIFPLAIFLWQYILPIELLFVMLCNF